MKNSTLLFIIFSLFSLFPSIVFARLKKSELKFIRPKTYLSKYDSLDNYFFHDYFHGKLYSQSSFLLEVENYRKTGRSQYLLPYINQKGSINYYFDESQITTDRPYHKSKIVLYIEPNDTNGLHILSFKEHAAYEAHNIGVFVIECRHIPHYLFYRVKLKFYCFTLISDNNKKINFYMRAPFGFEDSTLHQMSPSKRVALLIDENNYIVSILYDVKSEKDVLHAFGIR